jgi:hypothetical protein
MTGEQLIFAVHSGGTVRIELAECKMCDSKACIRVCMSQGGPLVLDAEQGVPALKWPVAQIEHGGCVECLGCELDCELHGRKAVSITLPMERLEEYLSMQAERIVYAGVR